MKGLPISEELHDYIAETFAPEDALLKRMPAEAAQLGIPLIHIDATQGKFLQILMRACNAKRVVEVGSLFGYSAIWMARALPADGVLVALEIAPLHAQAIRQNAEHAGLADKISVLEGDARLTLPVLRAQAPFDFAFVDADKLGYVEYYELVMALLRPGAIIVADNMSAHGNVWNAHADATASGNVQTIRALNQRMATDPRLSALLVPLSDGMCVGVVQ
jgi:caffeoyl-CoA O-methyltransferase